VTLIVNKIVDLVAAKEGSYCNNSEKLVKRVRVIKHYSCCGEKRHNSRTYIVEIKDIDNSDTSKE